MLVSMQTIGPEACTNNYGQPILERLEDSNNTNGSRVLYSKNSDDAFSVRGKE